MSWEDEVNAILATFPQIVAEPLEYRFHYDEVGNIIMCSMQQHPENTQYLIVDRETYYKYYDYYVNVSKKRIEKIDRNTGISVKLKKSDHGYAVVKNHAGLIIEADEEYLDIEYYDYDNN